MVYPKNFPSPPPALENPQSYLVKELSLWKIVNSISENKTSSKEIHRRFTFKSFSDTMKFMSEAADIFEVYPHHPRW